MDADGIGQSLNRLARLSSHIASHSGKHGEDRATCLLLSHLVTEGPQRSSALAEAMHADPSTISRHVSHLVKDGLVERVADPEDRRVTLLAATGEGTRWLEEMRERRNHVLARILQSWSDDDRRTLNTLLGRFVEDYEAHLPDLLSVLTAEEARTSRGEN